MTAGNDPVREKALQDYRKKLLEHKEVESRLKESEWFKKYNKIFINFTPFPQKFAVRESLKELTKQFDKSENDLKALQSVGQIVGEVLKQLTEDKCKWIKIGPAKRIILIIRFFQLLWRPPMVLDMW